MQIVGTECAQMPGTLLLLLEKLTDSPDSSPCQSETSILHRSLFWVGGRDRYEGTTKIQTRHQTSMRDANWSRVSQGERTKRLKEDMLFSSLVLFTT